MKKLARFLRLMLMRSQTSWCATFGHSIQNAPVKSSECAGCRVCGAILVPNHFNPHNC